MEAFDDARLDTLFLTLPLARPCRSMRREMARRHVEPTQFSWQLTSDQRLVGRIEWDSDTNGALPLIVIDGKPFTSYAEKTSLHRCFVNLAKRLPASQPLRHSQHITYGALSRRPAPFAGPRCLGRLGDPGNLDRFNRLRTVRQCTALTG